MREPETFTELFSVFMSTMLRVVEERGGGACWATFNAELVHRENPDAEEERVIVPAIVIANPSLAACVLDLLARFDQEHGLPPPPSMSEAHLEMLHDMTRKQFERYGYDHIKYRRNPQPPNERNT